MHSSSQRTCRHPEGKHATISVRSIASSPTSAPVRPLGAGNAAEPGTLTGRVTAESGQPLGSAGVIIEQLSAGGVTRSDGRYTIVIPAARVPSGPVTVTARLVGYKARSAQVNLSTGTAVQDFTLPD